MKKDNHLITYQSGGCSSQVDYILLQCKKFHLVKDIKVIPGEECIIQHRFLIRDLKLKISKNTEKKFVPKLRAWKLKDPSMKEVYVESLNDLLANYRIDNPDNVDDMWKYFKESVLSVTEKVCGWSKKGKWRQQTWWWDNSINDIIKEMRRLWKVWKNGGSKEDYAKAKKVANRAVFTAKRTALDDKFSNKDDVALFRIAKQIRKQNQDIVGEKCVKDDDNKLAYSDTAKKNAWKQYYQRLLNVEFPWDETSLSQIEPSIGPVPFITANMVLPSIQKMKLGKSLGLSYVIVEMLKASPGQCSQLIADLINDIVKEGKVPEE